MKQNGRNSTASLSVAKPLELSPRLQPDPELNGYESKVWVSVVDTKPADWFQKDTAHLLKAYCKHCFQASIIDAQLSEFDPSWLADKDGMDRFEKLNRLRDLNTKQINALSRSMRLTQQSQYDAAKAKRHSDLTQPGKEKKPWEI